MENNFSKKKTNNLFIKLLTLLLVFLTMSSTTLSYADSSILYDSQSDNCVPRDSSSSGNTDGSDGGTSVGDIPNTENIKKIYNDMHNTYGLSAEAIAGILGNFIMESAIDPRAIEGDFAMPNGRSEATAKQHTDGLMGAGYGQWTAERHTALVNWARDKHGDKYKWFTHEVQMDFMFHGDGGFIPILKRYALNSTSDPKQNAVVFHRDWEISADDENAIYNGRGGKAQEIYNYMKQNGMDGGKDVDKINRMISGGASSEDGNSSSTVGGNVEDLCGDTSSTSLNGEFGESTIYKEGGSNATTQSLGTDFEEVKKQYGQYIAFDLTTETVSDKLNGSPFTGGLSGQCTELTWAFMDKFWGGGIANAGNGGYVSGAYKDRGATVTDLPTTGYGFSATDGYAWAVGAEGHTGIVIGVLPDGSWIGANFNIPPNSSPNKIITYSLMDGTNRNAIKFFSGFGEPTLKK